MSENPKSVKGSCSRKWWIISLLGILFVGLLVGHWWGHRSAPTQKTQVLVEKEQKPTVWTCSMHPQIRMSKPGSCPLCGMDLIPAASDDSGGMTGMRQLSLSKNAVKLMDVETVPVERRFVTATLRMVGKVDYDETRMAYITSWVPGRLDRLYVDYTGVPVRKGDHLVYLYSPELYSAQEELLQAIKTAHAVQNSQLESIRVTAQQTIKAARGKLSLWGLKEEQIAEIEKRGTATDHMTIYAPVGGIVIHKNVLEGQYVQTGTQIYTIADLSHVWVKLDAYESDLAWLRYGQKIQFSAVSYPGEVFTGTIAFIDPILNEKTRTAKVRVNVPNLDGRLKPEMFVKAIAHSQVARGGKVIDSVLAGKWICPMHPEIIKDELGTCDICEMPLMRTESLGYISSETEQIEKPLVIPVTAALVTGTRAIVYVKVREDDKILFEGREIVLGPRAGDDYLVRSGLREGEEVVVKGSFKIDSALQLQAKPSMMTPDGGGGGGGHNHGGSDAGGSSEMTEDRAMGGLPAISRHQMQGVVVAADKVLAMIDEQKEVAQLQLAFSDLQKSVEAVDMKQLTGHTHMQWMEYSMRLTNDVTEGKAVKTQKQARRLADILTTNLTAFKANFGLQSGHVRKSLPVISEALRRQLENFSIRYFEMQQALANDDVEAASKTGRDISVILKEFDNNLLPEKEREKWAKDHTALAKILTRAVETEELSEFRESLQLLSQHLIDIARRYGSLGEHPFYLFHCPMAFGGAGGNWLQQNDQTRNPYFGKTMLKCGGVKEVISPIADLRKDESTDD